MPPPVPLPAYRPLVSVRQAIESSRAISEDERAWLRDRCAQLLDAYDQLQLSAAGRDDPRRRLAGEPAPRRAPRRARRLGRGQHRPPGNRPRPHSPGNPVRAPSSQRDAFIAAYGHDIRSWDGYPVLREIRELSTTSALLRDAHVDVATGRELQSQAPVSPHRRRPAVDTLLTAAIRSDATWPPPVAWPWSVLNARRRPARHQTSHRRSHRYLNGSLNGDCLWQPDGMSGPAENIPGYQTVRITSPATPVAELADSEAWQAREAYPRAAFVSTVFGVVREREEGGWELHPYFGALAPQDARDSMGGHFRRLAQNAEQAGDHAVHDECMQAAVRMDWEAIDEATVLGTRYGVVRADQFIRTGPAGPEPPRPTDPDPGEPDAARRVPDPAAGFVIDPATPVSFAEGMLKVDLLGLMPGEGMAPRDVRDDAMNAALTHPGGVLLPAAFMAAEQAEGRWGARFPETSPTPQGARDALASYLRVTVPWQLSLNAEQRAVYAAAADRLSEERADELTVAGRTFRIVRVERLVRIGPDGPEGPRPSDPDPQLPVLVQDQQMRAQGLVGDEEDENELAEPSGDAGALLQIFNEEEERRKERIAKRAARRSPSS